MITGIVESIGRVSQIDRHSNNLHIGVKTSLNLKKLQPGDSLAVNGVCLTLTRIQGQTFYADIMQETLEKTNLKYLQLTSQVNLERMAQIGNRISGHIVQGHIDTCAKIVNISQQANALWLEIVLAKSIAPYVVNKGSISVDGMSLTVVEAKDTTFTVMLIPHTQQQTIAQDYQVGDVVNLEVDMIAKHIKKLMEQRNV